MPRPETSIVIRAFNEERHLPRLFDALDRQTYVDFETIVVDSGSVDLTPQIATQRADHLIRIVSRDFTFGYSLNVGIREARGRFVAIISAHCFPTSADWLARLIAHLRSPRTAMVYGRQIGLPASKFSEQNDFRRVFRSTPRHHTTRDVFANNANSAISRECWEEFPFDETLPGLEDIHWARHWVANGYGVTYEPAAEVHHLHEESWRQVRRRYYREALAARWIGVKQRRALPMDVVRESAWLVSDLWAAARQGQLGARGAEIARYRYHKAVGAITGTLDGAGFTDARTREAMLFDRTGKSVVIHGSGRASLTDIEIPAPKPGDAVIKIAYEGVCGTDLEILNGTLSYYKTGKASYPITPGHEFSGRIVKLGPNVTHLSIGDRVVAECIQSCGVCAECQNSNWTACDQRREVGVIGLNGGYAEYVMVPGHFVHRVPEGVPLDRAAACEPLAVVLKGLKRLGRAWGGGPDDRKRCLVVGAGAIGHLAARVLAQRGHHVEIYDRTPARREAFAGSSIIARDTLDGILDFHALIDATGDPEALDAMLQRSRPGATILLLGLPYGRREYSFEDLVSYDKTVVGSVGSSAADFDEALEQLRTIDLTTFFGARFPLDQFEAAWAEFHRKGRPKVLLEVDGLLEQLMPSA